MDPLSSDFDFNMLPLEDLLRARDFLHPIPKHTLRGIYEDQNSRRQSRSVRSIRSCKRGTHSV